MKKGKRAAGDRMQKPFNTKLSASHSTKNISSPSKPQSSQNVRITFESASLLGKPKKIHPKSIYSVQEMQEFRPDPDVPLPELKTNGFIMLIHNTTVKSSKSPSGNYANNRLHPGSPSNRSSPALLIEHSGSRFVSTAYAKNVGKFDETSQQARISKANVHLNRLNEHNISTIYVDINKLELPDEVLVDLILKRVTSGYEEPEKNPQIDVLARLARRLAVKMSFYLSLVVKTGSLFESHISSPSPSSLIVQGLMVWIGHMFVQTILTRSQYFRSLEAAITRLDSLSAVEGVRASLRVSGPTISQRGHPEAASFYYFLHANKPSKGYLSFLVTDLLNLLQNEWNTSVSIQKSASKTRISRVVESEDDLLDIDLCSDIERQYQEWLEDQNIQPFFPPRACFKKNLRQCFTLFSKHVRDSYDFGFYIASIIKESSISKQESIDVFKHNQSKYSEIVINNDNVSLWQSVFCFYGSLIDLGFLNLTDLFDLFNSIPKSAYQPKVEKLISAVCDVTEISVEHIADVWSDPSISSETKACLVSVSVGDLNKDSNEELSASILVRDTVYAIIDKERIKTQHKEMVDKFTLNIPLHTLIIKHICKDLKVPDAVVRTIMHQFGQNV